jgi:hypothetical protein
MSTERRFRCVFWRNSEEWAGGGDLAGCGMARVASRVFDEHLLDLVDRHGSLNGPFRCRRVLVLLHPSNVNLRSEHGDWSEAPALELRTERCPRRPDLRGVVQILTVTLRVQDHLCKEDSAPCQF